ncbi:MAG: CBS domain-containing protein [Parcubacteria group bacterium]|nr:CBS domain-containing protein [Parcubacteria group bacterium]
MKTEMVTVLVTLTSKEAARRLIEHKISGAPVGDETGALVGIVSEKDIFRSFYPSYREFYENSDYYYDFERLEGEAQAASEQKTVADVMANRLITAEPDTPVLKVGAQMVASGIHRVPVVENGKLVGIVSRRDIYRAIMRDHLGLWEDKK